MSSDFVDILDECLDRLKAGDSVEACLTRYPAYADELEPLLETAHFAEALRATEPPRPEALMRGRNLFLAEAARLRVQEAAVPYAPAQSTQPTQPGLVERVQDFFAAGWLVPGWARATAVVVAVLLVFGAISGVAVQASETSLPGDSLYTLKQLTRQLQLLATFDPEEREETTKQFEAAERQEVQQATARGRVFREDITGVITDWRGDTLVLEGNLLVTITSATEIQGQPERGHLAVLQVRSEGGRLIAENVRVGAGGTQAVAVLVGTPTATAAVSATHTPSKAPTNTPSKVPTSTPTARTRATSTREPTKTYTPKPTFTSTLPPTMTPEVGFNLGIYELTGRIDAIESGSWVVDGQEILITSTTIISGEPKVGRRAHVRANRRSDGKFVAVEISVEKEDTPEPPEEVQLSGVVEKREGDDIWIIAGKKVRVDGGTEISGGDLKVGAFVDVDGVRESSSTIRALKITVVQVCANPVPLEGRIVSFSDDVWVIEVEAFVDGETVLVQYTISIDDDTDIQNTPVRGADVQVDTCRTGDNEYRARSIYVVPTPEPPTVTLTSEPPTVTSTPEVPTPEPPTVTSTPEPPTITTTPMPSPTDTPEPSPTPNQPPSPVPIPRTPTPTPESVPGAIMTPAALETASPVPGA